MKVSTCGFLIIFSIPSAFAQQVVWGQCGGQGWTGPTVCVSGSCCVSSNPWYYQCLPGGSCATTGTQSTTASKTSSAILTTTRPTTTLVTSSSKITTSSTTSSSKSSSKPSSKSSSKSLSKSTSKSTTRSTTLSTTRSTTSFSTTTKSTTSSAPVASYTNPVVYSDYADNDVFKGPDDAYYLSASNMHYSPGAPILKSFDLVNWEPVGHSVPFIDNGDSYNMIGGTAYRGGTWASTMRYRASNGKWYWIGCMNFWVTYVYTADTVTGPWTKSGTIYKCYYDCGLLIDDDDNMYVVYGGSSINLAQLTVDGLGETQSQLLFDQPSGVTGMEGNRMYKRNGLYYILNDYPSAGATYIWKSASPWGPWEYKQLHNGLQSPWYFMSFTWAYPAGRMPVLAPVTWGSDGFLSMVTDTNGGWGLNYPNPLPTVSTPSWYRTDTFSTGKLGPHWEFNHNPDNTNVSVSVGAVTLSACTITTDLYLARNTLTTRLYGPTPQGTIILDFNNMADGDRTGFAAFRDQTAWIGISREGSDYTLTVVHNITLSEETWTTVNNGTVNAQRIISKGTGIIWLKGNLDARAVGTKLVQFSYSTDGTTFTNFGDPYTLYTNWAYFMGYRWGIFNYATKALGGSVKLTSFVGGQFTP
ncbi:Beta-xylosidase [Dactylellina cionopaga]|nr:Beta-xylosidase [Dactylellina cionopaga]